jgi:hypothetical protein
VPGTSWSRAAMRTVQRRLCLATTGQRLGRWSATTRRRGRRSSSRGLLPITPSQPVVAAAEAQEQRLRCNCSLLDLDHAVVIRGVGRERGGDRDSGGSAGGSGGGRGSMWMQWSRHRARLFSRTGRAAPPGEARNWRAWGCCCCCCCCCSPNAAASGPGTKLRRPTQQQQQIDASRWRCRTAPWWECVTAYRAAPVSTKLAMRATRWSRQ